MKYVKLFEEFNVDTQRKFDFGDTISGIAGSDTSIIIQITDTLKPTSVMARYDVRKEDYQFLFNISDIRNGEFENELFGPTNNISGNRSGWRLPNYSEVDIMRSKPKVREWDFTKYEKPFYLFSNCDSREFIEMDNKLQHQLDKIEDLRVMDFITGEVSDFKKSSHYFCVRMVYDLYTKKYSDVERNFTDKPRFDV